MSIYLPRNLLNLLKNSTLFSQHNCLLCGTCSGDLLCPPCTKSLPHLPAEHCPVCLLPVAAGQVCGTCLSKPPAYRHVRAAFQYAFPIDALIQAFKYQKNLTIAPVLSQFMIEMARNTSRPDLIIPMPLHPKRLRERGFNQAVELSRPIAKHLNIPLYSNICTRIKNTPAQAALPWKARQKNIRNVFACTQDLTGKKIAIVDDVMTTGTTLNELAHILRKQGAAEVYGWVVARSMLQRPRH